MYIFMIIFWAHNYIYTCWPWSSNSEGYRSWFKSSKIAPELSKIDQVIQIYKNKRIEEMEMVQEIHEEIKCLKETQGDNSLHEQYTRYGTMIEIIDNQINYDPTLTTQKIESKKIYVKLLKKTQKKIGVEMQRNEKKDSSKSELTSKALSVRFFEQDNKVYEFKN